VFIPRTASAVRRGHQCGALLYPVAPQERGARGPLRRPLKIQCTEPSSRWVPVRARQVCPLLLVAGIGFGVSRTARRWRNSRRLGGDTGPLTVARCKSSPVSLTTLPASPCDGTARGGGFNFYRARR